MDIGIPLEVRPIEHRVGLTPKGVRLLTQDGHRCYLQQGAGEGAGFSDSDYERAGARVVYAGQEVYSRSDLVLKVGAPTVDELPLLRDDQTICAFWHLAAQPREVTRTLLDQGITAIAYERIRKEDTFPVLRPLSEIAGRMAPQIAARWLQNDGGGRGILISGLPGIPPTDVIIVGAGTVGVNAARAFMRMGARVFMLDESLERLQQVEQQFDGRVVTMVAYDFNIARVVQFADVLVTAARDPQGGRAPVLVTREMVRGMRPRSFVMDIAIDEGGNVETSRPTTHADPVFLEEEIIHYCVPNMSGVVAWTATNAYLNAAWPYIQRLAKDGTEATLASDPGLMHGALVHAGQVNDANLAMLLEEA